MIQVNVVIPDAGINVGEVNQSVNVSLASPNVVVTVPDRPLSVDLSASTVQITGTDLVGPAGPQGGAGPAGEPGPIGPSDEPLLTLHIEDETPHPPYDDQPSLVLLYENRLV